MILSANLRNAIYSVINKYANGVKVIWDKQAEARPPKPYISLDIISGPIRVGRDDEYVKGVHVAQKGIREIGVSVNYFGANAFEGLGRVQESLRLPTAREMLLDENVVFISDSGIRDLSALLENRFETRCIMDLKFRLSNDKEDLDTTIIEEVELVNQIDGSSNTVSVP